MRFLLFIFLTALVSCGQDGSKKGGEDVRQNDEYITDVREVDLLDVAMDVPIEVSGNKIIFKQSVSDSSNGVASTCSIGVTTGETYDFSVNGSSMMIKTSTGKKMTFTRVSGEGNDLVGSWSGKFQEGPMFVMKRMTFVSQDRLIMRTHCET
jgi:hypothetical protein